MSEPTVADRADRPYALTALWIALMAPLSVAGTVLQPLTAIPYEAFPLVMAGPAVAAGICLMTVPSWFPPSPPAARLRTWSGAVAVIVATSAAFVIVIVPFGGDRPAITPGDSPTAGAIAVVVVGLFAGSLMEEIGYRGVMYRALSARLTPTVSVVINGVFFGLCHLQYFGAGLVPVVLFLGGAVLIDVCMVAVWVGSWAQRILVAAIFHAAINIGLQLNGVAADRTVDFVGLAVGLTVSAAIATVVGRRFSLGDFGVVSSGASSPV